MIEQEILRKIEDFRSLGIPSYIPRRNRLLFVENMISTVIGARRAGKSYRVLQAADEMIQKKQIDSLNQICFLDFDNPILSGMKSEDLFLIQKMFFKCSPDFDIKTPLIFILDEIHKIPGWEEYVVDLSKNRNWKVIVTGSSSKLLRKDVATELRGKAISTELFPLHFKEYLDFKGFKHNKNSTKGEAEIVRLFEEYLLWGSYPACANLDIYLREALLREYFDTMILKDIIQRYNVSTPRNCIQLYRYMLSLIAKPYTVLSAYNYLKSIGLEISRGTANNFLTYAIDSWLFFSVNLFSDSIKEQERNYKKAYCIDWALAQKNCSVWDGSHSRSLENIVFIHLKRKWPRIHYYLTRKKKREIDFVPVDNNGKPVMAVQVCQDTGTEETLKREIEPLISMAKYFNIKENLILTMNMQEKVITENNVKIRIVPVWKWLIEEFNE